MNLSKEQEIEKLYEKFRKPLFRFISYKVSDIHSAEEILNDVFFKAAKSIESLKEKTKVQSWLYKIASNLIIDYYRRKKELYIEIEDDMSIEDDSNEETIFDEQNNLKLSTVKSQVKRGKESMKSFFEQCCTFEKDRLNNTLQCMPNNSCKNC
ncbi:MAG: hypothetical protein COB99_04280 [Sulfurimonas sp.]|nr:MAG: hypothetical protein COB99_04280 [Sulfurimonas sp.]